MIDSQYAQRLFRESVKNLHPDEYAGFQEGILTASQEAESKFQMDIDTFWFDASDEVTESPTLKIEMFMKLLTDLGYSVFLKTNPLDYKGSCKTKYQASLLVKW